MPVSAQRFNLGIEHQAIIPKDLALQLYRILILPHFDYSVIIYDPMTLANANQLKVIQNNCLWMGKEKRPSTDELQVDSNLPRLDVRRKHHVCQTMYKGLSGTPTSLINSMFCLVGNKRAVPTRKNTTDLFDVPAYKLIISGGNKYTVDCFTPA